MESTDLHFEIGFWHPFGPHAGETPGDIIKRKRNEIDRNGWTLWSFQFRNSLETWYKQIEKNKPTKVFVLCSEGKGAKDPAGKPNDCTYYIPVGKIKPEKIPDSIRVPHPMGNKTKGSAFIVKNIIYPTDYKAKSVEWLKDGKWQISSLPTRPEYLIRLGKGQSTKQVRAILELKHPYVAEIGY